jgi:hypothetical protein
VWFFATYRYADHRTASAAAHRPPASTAFKPDFEPSIMNLEQQPFVKVTTQLGPHELSGFYQNDKNRSRAPRALYRSGNRSAGGSMVLGKLNSVWGQQVTTSFSASYNNKGGNDGGATPQDLVRGCWSISCACLERPTYRQRHPRGDEQRRAKGSPRRW